MGRDKALLPWGGREMSLTLAARYRETLGAVAMAVDRPGRFPIGDALELPDAFPGKGPLNGIYSAFTQTAEDCILLTATDLPNGDPALALALRDKMGDADACVIRRRDGTLETLFAIYARSCLDAAAACLESGRCSVRAMLDRLRVRYVEEAELEEWELSYILLNVNTPEEYENFVRKEKQK